MVIHSSLLSGKLPPCLALAGTQASGQVSIKCKSPEGKPVPIMSPLPNTLGKQKSGILMQCSKAHHLICCYRRPPPTPPHPSGPPFGMGSCYEPVSTGSHLQHWAGDLKSRHCRDSPSALRKRATCIGRAARERN